MPVTLELYINSTMLVVRICQKPHSKIKHGSLKVLKCLSTGCLSNIVKPKSSSEEKSCISFEDECNSVDMWLCIILVMVLVTTRKKPHSKIPSRSLEILNWASMCHPGKSTKLDSCSEFCQTWSQRFADYFQII